MTAINTKAILYRPVGTVNETQLKTMTTRSNNQADAILLAATEVIAERGTGKLTIDAVAKQAGLSKGGVLYHYPTKDALLQGLLAALMAKLDDRRNQNQENSALSAMLQSLDFSDETERYMSLALLAASAEKPELLDPARTYFGDVVNDVRKESNDKDLATILLLALEGLRFMHMLDLTPWSSKQTKQLVNRMQQMSTEVRS